MPILAYHMVEPRFDLSITRVKPDQFRRQIERALASGYRFITLREYLAQSQKDEKCIALTFDDGYESLYQYAFPVLHEYDIRATVFIITHYLGKMDDWDVNFGGIRFRHLDADGVRTLHDAGWEIGSHTCSHWDLTRLSAAGRMEEVAASRMELERLIQSPVETISYPFGNTNAEVIADCRVAGYKAGVVMGRSHVTLEKNFSLTRIGVYLFDSPWLFSQKLVAKKQKMFNFIQRGIDFCSDGTVLVRQGIGKPKK